MDEKTMLWIAAGVGAIFLLPKILQGTPTTPAAGPAIAPTVPPGNVTQPGAWFGTTPPPPTSPVPSAPSAAPPVIAVDVATMTPDGVLHLSGQAGEVGAFALAVTNTGGAGNVVVSVWPIAATMPPLSMEVCQTDAHGNCLSPAAKVIGLMMPAGGTAMFSVFVSANPGQSIALNPSLDAIVVQFSDGAQALFGSVVVPVTTA